MLTWVNPPRPQPWWMYLLQLLQVVVLLGVAEVVSGWSE